MTPEGKIKQKVKAMLKTWGGLVYSHWPVMNGMGAPELDCNITINGYAVSVETKAPSCKLTERQKITASEKRVAGGIVVVVKDDNDIRLLGNVLRELQQDAPQIAARFEDINKEKYPNG